MRLPKLFRFSRKRKDDPPPYRLPEEFSKHFTENQLQILRDYDTVIIVDDSASMRNDGLWGQACDAVAVLAGVASQYDKDGVDIYFLNQGEIKINGRKKNSRRFMSEQEVRQLFKDVQPEEGSITPIGMCLEKATGRSLKKLRDGESCKNTNYLVITDGEPTDGAEESIVYIAQQLENAGAPLCQMGFQFIQIGKNEKAKEFLANLDNDLKAKYGIRDMIDTEQYPDGVVTALRLAKLLLGGINRKIDDQKICDSKTDHSKTDYNEPRDRKILFTSGSEKC